LAKTGERCKNMLKIISSKNEGEIYGLATKLKPKEVGSFLDCEISEAQMHAENISILKWDKPVEKKESDINRKEIYDSTHQFFISENSMYL
jgi:hypothetical protein